MYVQDCIDAMLLAIGVVQDKVSILNLGTDEYVEVNDSIRCIVDHLGISPELKYAGGERGWIGDSPFIFLNTAKVRALGWQPKLSIREAVVKTVEYLQGETWLLERR
jgi:UDP-glucose 4-epimerase